ncbi:MAG: ADP-ribose pyrophosphatase YjhB (NUDIX family) [Acidimicrobiales bacterium]|jgi:ADP-ribose pyrophosphatase YjhB (NUDIX family)
MKDEQEVHFEGKIAQKVIVEVNNTVLLVQDPRGDKDTWELPGGRMNISEDPRAAMQREFFEEMGVHINVHEVVHMEQFIQGNEGKRAFVIVYRATLVGMDVLFKTDAQEVSHVDWFTQEQVSTLTLYPEYENALEVYFKSKNT